MTHTTINSTEAGRAAAMATYVLYLLSIPSAGVLALVGVIVAYLTRAEAGPLARSHLDDAIRIWWVAFWWGVAIVAACVVGTILTVVLIGFPILWIAGIIGFIVMIWFTVKSLLGLLALIDGRGR
ncbi:MAG: hypothetical protein AB7G05_15380 [Hyphomonadaceae bacterium]